MGASTSAAPVTAALLAMKALGKLYANPSTVGKYNIVLVVATASAGMWDNAGMKAWLRKSSTSALLANVELAMHLQSVGNDPIVYSTRSLQLPAVLAFTNYSGVHVEPCLDNSDSVYVLTATVRYYSGCSQWQYWCPLQIGCEVSHHLCIERAWLRKRAVICD